jgi:hypothetical protein
MPDEGIPSCVLLLGPDSPPGAPFHAAHALSRLAQDAEEANAIVAAGGIAPLVQLRPGTDDSTSAVACLALKFIGFSNAENRAAVVAAGAAANMLPEMRAKYHIC